MKIHIFLIILHNSHFRPFTLYVIIEMLSYCFLACKRGTAMLKFECIDNQKEEWVVFIHGIGGSTKTWKKQIEDFSENYNLLLLDLPGHGLNSDNIIYKVDAQKLYKGIKETMDYLQIPNAHFVGLSMGTIVIANFAVCYPEYVDTIILGGSSLKLRGIYKAAVILANKMKRIVPYDFLYQFFAFP